MGLDIYLKKCNDRAAAQKRAEEFERRTEGSWSGDTEEAKEAGRKLRKEIAEELGVDEWGTPNEIEEIANDSATKPEHMFKIGYFRSSYNDGGINNVLKQYGVDDLYAIFARGRNDDYEFAPDWVAAQSRATAAVAALEQAMLTPSAQYTVSFMNAGLLGRSGNCTDEAQALAITMEVLKKQGSNEYGFSNAEGSFYPKGIEVVGFVGGRNFMSDGVYAVHKCADRLSWYLDALKIVLETIEYVIAQPDSEKFYFAWSA